MTGRTLITRKFIQLLVALAMAVSIILIGLYIESIPMMVGGVGLAWLLSRYGHRIMRCPYCGITLYKQLFQEAAIWASWVSWSQGQTKQCPSCETNFDKRI